MNHRQRDVFGRYVEQSEIQKEEMLSYSLDVFAE